MVIKKIKKFAKQAQKKYKKLVDNIEILETETPEVKPEKHPAQKAEKRYVYIAHGDITRAIVTAILLGTLTWIIYQISAIIMLFFVSLLFAAALDPTVDMLERYKIPRGVSVIGIFIVLIAVIVLFIVNLAPVLANQLLDLGVRAQELIGNLSRGEVKMPSYLEWLNPILQNSFAGFDSDSFGSALQNYLVQFGQELKSFAGNVAKTFVAISNGVANFIVVLTLTFFMTVDERNIDGFVLKLFPTKYGKYITQKTSVIKLKVGAWLRGQIALMIAVGLATYIGLIIIGVEYSFTLALVAGLTELIPVIGPMIGWVAAIPIAANQSGSTLLWVTILYFMIQRLENNILVPIIMKKATGLNPVVVIFAMLVGFEFLGIVGVIISVPVAAIIGIFIDDYLEIAR